VAQILVVDDDEIVRGMVAFLFEDEGYTVATAADGGEALDLLRADPPQCMVLDLMMPGVDGLTVLRRRAEEQIAQGTRVVVLTAKTGHQDAVWCWEAGADEYLTKPFEPDRLVRIVRELAALTPREAQRRREVGLAEARRLDALEAAVDPGR
jgi:CheY-like chemotaxis protein